MGISFSSSLSVGQLIPGFHWPCTLRSDYEASDTDDNSDNRNYQRKCGLVGLKNLGNTCFMNSAIQCLSNTAPLANFFLQSNWRNEINRTNPLSKNGEIADAFGELMALIWGGSRGGNDVISPVNFKKTVGKHFLCFGEYEQHDSQELLAFLLDGLHEDLNRVKVKPYIEDILFSDDEDEERRAEKAWTQYSLRNSSIIVDYTQGQLKSTLHCLTCGARSVKFDTFMYLSVPIPPTKSSREHVTVQDCLRNFCSTETLTDGSRWRCPCCNDFTDTEKSLKLWSLPSILIIHLKRFKVCPGGRRVKINRVVDFPLNGLDMSAFLTDARTRPLQAPSRVTSEEALLLETREPPIKRARRDSGGPIPISAEIVPSSSSNTSSDHSAFSSTTSSTTTSYVLYGALNHHGSLIGGHYTAYAKNRLDKRWYLFNDSLYKEADPNDICSNAAYVLFYEKKDISEENKPPSERSCSSSGKVNSSKSNISSSSSRRAYSSRIVPVSDTPTRSSPRNHNRRANKISCDSTTARSPYSKSYSILRTAFPSIKPRVEIRRSPRVGYYKLQNSSGKRRREVS